MPGLGDLIKAVRGTRANPIFETGDFNAGLMVGYVMGNPAVKEVTTVKGKPWKFTQLRMAVNYKHFTGSKLHDCHRIFEVRFRRQQAALVMNELLEGDMVLVLYRLGTEMHQYGDTPEESVSRIVLNGTRFWRLTRVADRKGGKDDVIDPTADEWSSDDVGLGGVG